MFIHWIRCYFWPIPNDIAYRTETKDMGVRLLEHDWSTSKESKHIDFKVLRVLVHEKYDHDADDNDVALLSLDTEGVDFGPKTGISPVCMPPAGT